MGDAVKPKEKKQFRPFLKWAGGKTQLLEQFEKHYPHELKEGRIGRYVEPFLGSGAVFLDLVQRYKVGALFLSDYNAELILAYRVIQRDPERLIERLNEHQLRYQAAAEDEREGYFYKIRDGYNRQLASIDFARYSDRWITRAAHMIFLNKTCYNGLFRVNASGRFNVPFGRYKKPSICDAENIWGVSTLLQAAELRVAGFQECARFVTDDAFVYFDPPYRPLSATASFTSYSKAKFNDTHQRELAAFFTMLDAENGAKLMLSNSDPTNTDPNDTFFDDLYAAHQIHRVRANRMINSNAAKRGKITELLVTNYVCD